MTRSALIAGYIALDGAINHIISNASVEFGDRSSAIQLLAQVRAQLSEDMSTADYLLALDVANIRSEHFPNDSVRIYV